MSGLIPYPTSSKKLPKSWAERVTDAANAVRRIGAAGMLTREMGPLGSGAEPHPDNKRNRRGMTRPLPFEVRFDASLDNGGGGWKIYLPTEHLVQLSGAYLDPIVGATAIQDEDGEDTPWFEFDEITLQDDHIWLVISEADSGSANGPQISAAFEAEASESEGDISICIAEVSYVAGTNGESATVEIKQSAVGAIIIGGEGGNGGSSIVAADGPFSPIYDDEGEDPEVVVGFANCYYQVGGFTRLMSDVSGLPVATGFIALRINANSATPGAVLVGFATFAALVEAQANTNYLHVPLYRMANSKISLDMRRMPFMQLAEVF